MTRCSLKLVAFLIAATAVAQPEAVPAPEIALPPQTVDIMADYNQWLKSERQVTSGDRLEAARYAVIVSNRSRWHEADPWIGGLSDPNIRVLLPVLRDQVQADQFVPWGFVSLGLQDPDVHSVVLQAMRDRGEAQFCTEFGEVAEELSRRVHEARPHFTGSSPLEVLVRDLESSCPKPDLVRSLVGLTKGFGEQYSYQRGWAMTVLAAVLTEDEIAGVARELLRPADPGLRYSALGLVARRKVRQLRPEVTALLNDPGKAWEAGGCERILVPIAVKARRTLEVLFPDEGAVATPRSDAARSQEPEVDRITSQPPAQEAGWMR